MNTGLPNLTLPPHHGPPGTQGSLCSGSWTSRSCGKVPSSEFPGASGDILSLRWESPGRS